jgi:hypothetical protein
LYAELMLQAPTDWPFGTDAEDNKSDWAVACLQQLAVFPHITG